MGVELSEPRDGQLQVDEQHSAVAELRAGVEDGGGRGGAHEAGEGGEGDGAEHERGFEQIALRGEDENAAGLRFDGVDGGVGEDADAGVGGGFGVGVADLAEALARVIEAALAGGGEHLAEELAQGAGGDAAAGLLGVDVRGVEAPDFAGVGEVEVAADGGAEAVLEDGGEGLFELPGVGFEDGLGEDAGGEGGRSVEGDVQGLEGEVEPAVLEEDAAVAGAFEEIVAEQGADIGEDFGRTGRMQAVAAVVDAVAGDGEAGGIAAGVRGTLEQGDLEAAAGEQPGKGEAGGAGAEDGDGGQIHGATLQRARASRSRARNCR